MTVPIHAALEEGAAQLAAAGLDDSRADASLLLMHVLHCDRAYMLAHPERSLSPPELETFRSFILRRAAGEPVQYITGHQEFFKFDFEVTPDVLIPRPETELIVELALELFPRKDPLTFADVGTGSGCIAISLLHELPHATAVAIDVSPAALAVAQRNAERHVVRDRLQLIESDGFESLKPAAQFELIVSNPPYVSDEEMQKLQREVQQEPIRALSGGPDGFTVIRRLLRDAPAFLEPRGYFIFEIGFGQAEAVTELIDQRSWELIEIRRDLAGIPRTVVLRKQ